MIFTQTRPTQEGFYWCYLKDPSSMAKSTLEVGQIRRISNGYLGTVSGAFDYDWGDWLYWGDRIEAPNQIELKQTS